MNWDEEGREGAPLLSFEGVNKYFSKRGKEHLHVLKDINLTLHSGSCVGLVGSSGCGKSTIARLIAALHRPESGTVRFRGRDIFDIPQQEYYRQVQMVFQDPASTFPRGMKIGRYLLEPFRNFGLAEAKGGERFAAELLERVELPGELLTRHPNQLSGGQLQRIVFARAAALKPALLLCDEATSALDVTVQAKIMQLFARLQQESGFATLFITHDLALAEGVCDTIHVMANGEIVETLTSGNLLAEAQHPVSRELLAAASTLTVPLT